MPIIGETIQSNLVGKSKGHLMRWSACPSCGKERWVNTRFSSSMFCWKCAIEKQKIGYRNSLENKDILVSTSHELGRKTQRNNTLYFVPCPMCGKKRWKEKYFLSQLCGSCAFYKAHPECIRKTPVVVEITSNNIKDISNNKDPYHQRFNWDDLRELYIVKNLSAYAIAEIKHCKASAVYQSLRRKDIPVRSLKDSRNLRLLRGEQSPNYKGGKLFYGGYIKILSPNHPFCDQQGYVTEHRLVMEKKLGRYLTPEEHIHHINGIRHDNKPDNLELLSPSNHTLKEQFCRDCPLKREIKLLRGELFEKDNLIDIRCA